MNFTRFAAWRPAALALTAAVALAATAACGGDDDAANEKTLDTGQAAELAHQALLDADDLPGSGWIIDEEDNFEESPNADTKACNEINARRDEARKKSDPERAGRAQRSFTREGANSSTDVEIEVNIFNNTAVPAESLRLQRAAYDANLRECFLDTLTENSDPSVKLEVKDVAVLGTLPGEGVAKALDVSLSDETESLRIRLETYNWRFGNAGVSVTISGNKDDITFALVKTVLDAAQAKLDAAAE